jgi:3-oxoacyl-[acyl-carrier-protein] synthase-3
VEVVATRSGIPAEKVKTILKHYGNHSAALNSVPLDEAVKNYTVKKGGVIACTGFKAGLS